MPDKAVTLSVTRAFNHGLRLKGPLRVRGYSLLFDILIGPTGLKLLVSEYRAGKYI